MTLSRLTSGLHEVLHLKEVERLNSAEKKIKEDNVIKAEVKTGQSYSIITISSSPIHCLCSQMYILEDVANNSKTDTSLFAILFCKEIYMEFAVWRAAHHAPVDGLYTSQKKHSLQSNATTKFANRCNTAATLNVQVLIITVLR